MLCRGVSKFVQTCSTCNRTPNIAVILLAQAVTLSSEEAIPSYQPEPSTHFLCHTAFAINLRCPRCSHFGRNYIATLLLMMMT